MKVYGKYPAKPVYVEMKPSSDPKQMMEGMEEYLFKQAQALDFGETKVPVK